jgi:hypothetical protein
MLRHFVRSSIPALAPNTTLEFAGTGNWLTRNSAERDLFPSNLFDLAPDRTECATRLH